MSAEFSRPFPYPREEEIHIWVLDAPPTPPREDYLDSLLAPDERARADHFRRPLDRERFVRARGILRILLSRYTGGDPATLAFGYGKHGKPFLGQAPERGELGFNVSHAEDLFLYAFARTRDVGIDVELLGPRIDTEELSGAFTLPEREALDRLSPELRQTAAIQLWTRKEAYAKAVGEGLSLAPRPHTLSIDPDRPASLLLVDEDDPEGEAWSIIGLRPTLDSVGAVAARGRGWTVSCLDAMPFLPQAKTSPEGSA